MHNRELCAALAVMIMLTSLLPVRTTAAPAAPPADAQYDTVFNYDHATLVYWQDRYRKSMPKVLDVLRSNGLSQSEQAVVRKIDLVLPLSHADLPDKLRAGVSGDPFTFFSVSEQATIYLSVTSTLFVQDLSKAYAWLFYNNCTAEPLADYLAMLKYHRPGEFPGGRYPTPLEVLNIPEGTFDDSDDKDTPVEALALALFNEARAFIIGHELGHIRYKHAGGDKVDAAKAQQNESQADSYALKMLTTTQTVPLGAYLLFFAWTNYLPNRWDFASDQEWQAELDESTHPWTPARMQAIANGLTQSAALYPAKDRLAVASIATDMAKLAEVVADPASQQSVKVAGEGATVSGLQTLCRPAAKSQPATNQLFDGAFSGQYVHYALTGPEFLTVTTELHRSADNVIGTFNFGVGVGRIRGRVKDKTLYFTWRWSTTSGSGIFDSDEDGTAFSGTWGYGNNTSDGGTWSGEQQ